MKWALRLAPFLCFLAFYALDHGVNARGGKGGISGVCGPHAAPTAAAAAGLNCETFWDGPFAATTIDVNDTGNVGPYKWYTHNAFPQWPGGSGTINSPNCATCIWNMSVALPTPPGDYSFSSGNIVISPVNSGNYGGMPIMLSTIRSQPASPTGYVGQTFKYPLYVEFVVPSAGITGGNEPDAIIWMIPTSFLMAGVGNSYHFPEIDICEFAYGCSFIHDWAGAGAGTASTDNQSGLPTASYSGSSTRLGFLFQPGSQKYYQNDVLQGTMTWSAGGGVSPAATPNNPAGTFQAGDSMNFGLFMGAGRAADGKSLTVQQIRVWQPSL
jgi:hypothetical protein